MNDTLILVSLFFYSLKNVLLVKYSSLLDFFFFFFLSRIEYGREKSVSMIAMRDEGCHEENIFSTEINF